MIINFAAVTVTLEGESSVPVAVQDHQALQRLAESLIKALDRR